MSYIDDLKNAASRATVASDRADGASKIIYDVANGPVDATIDTENGPVLTLAHAVSRIQFMGGLDIAGLPNSNIPLTGDELFVVVQDGADVKLTLQDIQQSISAGVSSVNGLDGAVVLTTDEVLEGALNKYFTAADELKLDGIEDGAQVNTVISVNNKIGIVELDAGDVGAIDISEKGAVFGVATLDTNGKVPEAQLPSSVTGGVNLVNGQDDIVILNTDDISEGVNNKYFSSAAKTKLDGIEPGAEVNSVLSVNGEVGNVVIAGEVGEAPIDGKLYGRQDAMWKEITQGDVFQTETVISTPTNGETNVNIDLTITTEAFTSPFSEAHVSTDWVVLSSDGTTVIWQSLADTTNLVSVTLPAGTLQEETSYIVRARHTGSILGEFPWSSDVSFTTEVGAIVFDPSSAGTPFGGGYYAGANIIVGGTSYALVVAPKAMGGESTSTIPWGWTANPDVPGATSTNDGKSNTTAIVAAGGSSSSVAAGFCNNLTINGYSDWHLPSKDELEICYRYLKPTTQNNNTSSGSNPNSSPLGSVYTSSDPLQTSLVLFQSGGDEAFKDIPHWSSMQNSPGQAWLQSFGNGNQFTGTTGGGSSVRAVRWVEVV